MPDVFVSYAREQRQVAMNLSNVLGFVGLSVWWDDGILAGDLWHQRIQEELLSSKCVLVIWSSDAASSEWVLEEASEGRRVGKVVAIRYGDCIIPQPFQNDEILDFTGWLGTIHEPRVRTLIEMVNMFAGNDRCVQWLSEPTWR